MKVKILEETLEKLEALGIGPGAGTNLLHKSLNSLAAFHSSAVPDTAAGSNSALGGHDMNNLPINDLRNKLEMILIIELYSYLYYPIFRLRLSEIERLRQRTRIQSLKDKLTETEETLKTSQNELSELKKHNERIDSLRVIISKRDNQLKIKRDEIDSLNLFVITLLNLSLNLIFNLSHKKLTNNPL